MSNIGTLRDKYPHAFEDDKDTIWVSREACEAADWTYKHGDAFLDDILGWDWQNAEENFTISQREAKRKAFWKAHPRLRSTCWFLRSWYGALAMFAGTVGRDYYGRITPALAWRLASDLWLKREAHGAHQDQP